MSKDRVAKMLLDPASIFSSPMAVVDDESLSNERKIEILRHWEYDVRELEVAEEEGFRASQPECLLDTIVAALHRLGTGPDTEHSPPTKHGGV